MTGRGRGESKRVDLVDESDARTAEDRRRQLESAEMFGMVEGDMPIRGRGGFRQTELRTIPANISQIRSQNIAGAKPADILCNYVEIKTKPNFLLQMYRVDFEPKIESQSRMRFLYRTAAGKVFTKVPMYDGVHECRSSQTLPDRATHVEVMDDRADPKQNYKVTFTHTGTTAVGAEMIRTYNLHIKEFFRILGYYAPQPGLFVHPQQSSAVGDEIMMLRGFRTAANMHDDSKILMNFEGSHKLVQRQNVLAVMEKIRRQSPGDMRENIRTALTGKLVVTVYNKRAYRVEDVDFSSNPGSTFKARGTGDDVSYIDYFRQTYNQNIQDVKQPLLIVVPNNTRRRGEETRDGEIKLIPELCNIAGLTDQQRNDNRLKMDLIRASQIPPNERVRHLQEFLRAFHSNAEIQQSLNSWGYSYDAGLVKMRGLILAPTHIGSGRQAAESSMATWPKADDNSADFQVRACAVTPVIARMAFITGRGELQNRARISNVLQQGFGSIGLQVTTCDYYDIQEGDQPAHFARTLRNVKQGTTIAIVVLRNQNKNIYDTVKKTACSEMGLLTQVITSRLMCDERKARSAATKIAIQVAAKVGGEPWWVDIPLKGAMVCGYDTYHDTANRGRSFGAFLASMNVHYSKWFSKADLHDRLEEMSNQVAINMLEALNAYKTVNNGSLPDRVIIYRDGVGEGQIEHVFKNEVKGIAEKIASVTPPGKPKIRLTVVIVNKRIGARFYMRANDNRFINPPPGTIIDHAVTRSERYDFYLISQSTRQGTITPTYYNIIHDEAGFGPDIHQKMAFKFCMLYYNWSGSVRVPAPCQYAHKLALLCGEHMHSQPNSNLNDRLHFL